MEGAAAGSFPSPPREPFQKTRYSYMNTDIMKAALDGIKQSHVGRGEASVCVGLLGLFSVQQGKMNSSQEQELCSQAAWVQIPALPRTCCVTSGELLNYSVPQFPHL